MSRDTARQRLKTALGERVSMKNGKLIIPYLKYRFILLPLLLIEVIRNPYYKNFVDSSDSVREFSKYLFLKSAAINNIVDNCVVMINGQVRLLSRSIGLNVLYLAVVFLCIHFSDNRRRKSSHNVSGPSPVFLLHLIWSAVFCLVIKSFQPVTALFLTALINIVYAADFIFFNSESFFSSRTRKNVFMAFSATGLFVTEWLCFPLYLKFLYLLQGKAIPPRKAHIIQQGHYSLVVFITLLLMTPLESSSLVDMHLLQKGYYYDLQYYENGDALIVLNDLEGQVERISVEHMAPPVILYKAVMPSGTEDSMGDWLAVNNETQELYFTDRGFHQLLIMDLTTHSIKQALSSPLFNAGDNYITYLNNRIYGLTEEGLCIYKLNPADSSPAETMLSVCIREGEGSMLVPNKKLGVLYATNWNEPSSKFFIYKVDAETLAILNRFPLTSPGIVMVSEDGERLHCGVSTGPVNIFTIDARSMNLLDRFLIPYGTENGALDRKRGLLFAANHFTNIIEVIDLKTKKTVRYFRAGEGRSYIRRIIVDALHRRFFVTVFNEGIYVGNY